jgi:hypothetical protein
MIMSFVKFGAVATGMSAAAFLMIPLFSVPAEAKGKCVRAGGQGSNVLPDVAKFMANAALKNSIAAHGWKPAGKIAQTCKSDGLMTTCVSRQRACP